MFGRFSSPTCPLPTRDKARIETSMLHFARGLGSDMLLDAHVLEPSRELIADRTADADGARRLLLRICPNLGIASQAAPDLRVLPDEGLEEVPSRYTPAQGEGRTVPERCASEAAPLLEQGLASFHAAADTLLSLGVKLSPKALDVVFRRLDNTIVGRGKDQASKCSRLIEELTDDPHPAAEHHLRFEDKSQGPVLRSLKKRAKKLLAGPDEGPP